MSNVKKLMMTAAGGGEPVNVEDVFSTYLYTGTSAARGITNGIALADGVGGGTSTQFDGSDDYFNRSSDLTGNADGKTFTFSAWIYPEVGNKKIYHIDSGGGGTRFQIAMDTSGSNHVLRILASQAGSSSTALYAPNAGTLTLNAWNHILCSFDMTNTSNRYVYINDVAQSVTYNDYVNANLEFTMAQYLTVGGALYSGGAYGLFKGKIAHVFLDYTYRDLSTTSNRRLFIDADGGSTSPSTLSALSPIVYLPMTEDYTVGENLGTGGDFTGNGSPTIVSGGSEYQSGVGQGGLVWIKSRSSTREHSLYDTERGVEKLLKTNSTGAEQNTSGGLTAFNSNGFSLGTYADINGSAYGDFTSWTFRKAPKFFDVVTWTGDGVAGRTVSHNLGSVPGCIIVKKTSAVEHWTVYHRSVGATKWLELNNTNAQQTGSTIWNDTAPTSTEFTVGSYGGVNGSGATYVAYLFAHNDGDGEFGPTGDQDIIKCGNYTGAGATDVDVDLGFEPQWVLIKKSSASGDQWLMLDSMRGTVTGGNDNRLFANLTNAEAANDYLEFTSTGFRITGTSGDVASSGGTYIYIAIRRGPMAVPTDATDVFAASDEKINYTSNNDRHSFNSGFPVDSLFYKGVLNSTSGHEWYDRIRPNRLFADDTTAQDTISNWIFDKMEGVWEYGGSTSTNNVAWMWRRATGFFDCVPYRGTGSSSLTVNHNLGVVPEMMWVKRTSGTSDWKVYHKDLPNLNSFLRLNHAFSSNNSETNVWPTAPTATQLTIGNYTGDYVGGGDLGMAYLFATLSGISKVGSYSGNSGTQTIDCGFSNGAALVIIKRYDSSGAWFAWDSARGIVSGNDPYLLVNSTVAQTTGYDAIDPHASGFTLNNVGTGTNDSGASYIFYAVAA